MGVGLRAYVADHKVSLFMKLKRMYEIAKTRSLDLNQRGMLDLLDTAVKNSAEAKISYREIASRIREKVMQRQDISLSGFEMILRENIGFS